MSLTHLLNNTARLSLSPRLHLPPPSYSSLPRSLFLTHFFFSSNPFSRLSLRVSHSSYSSKRAMGDTPDAGMDAVQRRLMFEDECVPIFPYPFVCSTSFFVLMANLFDYLTFFFCWLIELVRI